MPVSMNRCIEYFVDALTGYSTETRRNYERDLQQFKLYLVLFRSHTLVESNLEKLELLRKQLELADGKLWDTRSLKRHYDVELTSQTILDWFDVNLELLHKEDIVGFFGYLESTKRLGRASLLRRLASLRQFFRLLVKEGYPVAPDVIERLRDINIRRERRLPLALDESEVLAFLNEIDNVRDRTIIILMLFMGLRISEVVHLNIGDITAHTSGITLRGKGAKERYVPVHPRVWDAIRVYLSVRPEAAVDAYGEPLFASNRCKRIDTSTVRRFIKKYSQEVTELDSRKRRKLSPHKFRHTFATMLLSNGVDIRYIQELLGHQNLSTTEIYTSVRSAELERAVSKHPLSNTVGSTNAGGSVSGQQKLKNRD